MLFFPQAKKTAALGVFEYKILSPFFVLPGDDKVCSKLRPGRVYRSLRTCPQVKNMAPKKIVNVILRSFAGLQPGGLSWQQGPWAGPGYVS
jgi:hypothetical protein